MHRMRLLSVIAFLWATTAPIIRAQVRVDWTDVRDGPAMSVDYGVAIAATSNGTVYVTGNSALLIHPLLGPILGAMTAAMDSAGNRLWTRYYAFGRRTTFTPGAIALGSQGNVHVVGSEFPAELGSPSFQALVVYSPTGAQLLARRFGSATSRDVGTTILIDAQDNIYLGGRTGNWPLQYPTVRKLDAAGNELWLSAPTSAPIDAGSVLALALANNGDILAAGYVGQNDSNLSVMRVDPTGIVSWLRQFDAGPGTFDHAFGVASDAQGNVYVAGEFAGSSADTNVALVALDPAGNTLWLHDMDGGSHGDDKLRAIRIDAIGRIVVAGQIEGDALLMVIDPLGNTIWERRWDGPSHGTDFATDFSFDPIGNIHLSGTTSNPLPPFDSQGFAVGYDPDGGLRYAYVQTAGPQEETSLSHVVASSAQEVSLVGTHWLGLDADILTVQVQRTAVPTCFGDGSGTACPCGNASATLAQSGCLHSLGYGGRLIDSGASSLSSDTLVLNGTNMTLSSCLYFQGTTTVSGGSGAAFGDGLRCAGGTTVRLGTKQNTNGSSQYPQPGDASVSVRGNVASPGERTYQVWFRNAASFCTSATFNLTNGLRVTWIP